MAEAHVQVLTTNRFSSFEVKPDSTAPGPPIPPASSVRVVPTGGLEGLTLVDNDLTEYSNIFPEAGVGFRLMTGPELAVADAEWLADVQVAAKAFVDGEVLTIVATRALVQSHNSELNDAATQLKVDIDAAVSIPAVVVLIGGDGSIGDPVTVSSSLNDDLLDSSLDSTFDAVFDGDNEFNAGPETESAGTYLTMVSITIPSFVHGGKFRIDWCVAAQPGNSNRAIEVKLFDVTDTVDLTQEFRFEPKDNADIVSVGGHTFVTVADSTAKTIAIQFRKAGGSGTVTAHDGQISVYRRTSN